MENLNCTKFEMEKVKACGDPKGNPNRLFSPSGMSLMAADWLTWLDGYNELKAEVVEAVANADKFATQRDAALKVLEDLFKPFQDFDPANDDGECPYCHEYQEESGGDDTPPYKISIPHDPDCVWPKVKAILGKP